MKLLFLVDFGLLWVVKLLLLTFGASLLLLVYAELTVICIFDGDDPYNGGFSLVGEL